MPFPTLSTFLRRLKKKRERERESDIVVPREPLRTSRTGFRPSLGQPYHAGHQASLLRQLGQLWQLRLVLWLEARDAPPRGVQDPQEIPPQPEPDAPEAGEVPTGRSVTSALSMTKQHEQHVG